MTDAQDARRASLHYLRTLSIEPPQHLPVLDADRLRDTSAASARMLCIVACGAVAYGFPRERASSWLLREGLSSSLEIEERKFLASAESRPEPFQWQIEGAYSLAWALGLQSHLDLRHPCGADFVHAMPNLKIDESSATVRRNAQLRSLGEVVQAADAAYLIDWLLQDRASSKVKHIFEPNVVRERRRALDWLLSEDRWYAISLDT